MLELLLTPFQPLHHAIQIEKAIDEFAHHHPKKMLNILSDQDLQTFYLFLKKHLVNVGYPPHENPEYVPYGGKFEWSLGMVRM